MRNEQEMMRLILNVAERDERIRLVTLEGSRTNPNIAPDRYQDYDVSYFVTDLESFTRSDGWLDVFGKRIFMQKPEDMELFPPTLGTWYSYLMLFEDGNRIDLTLIPLDEAERYFADSDGLVSVMLDKDTLVPHEATADDRKYWISRPTVRQYDDCCNEFWWVSTYVAKGLARSEILYAIDHLHAHVRPNLLRMMKWYIGWERGYTFSVGKNDKFIERYLPSEDWVAILATYRQDGYSELWQSLFACQALFRTYSRALAERLGCPYPSYDEAISRHIHSVYGRQA